MNAINPTSRSMQKIAWFFIILMITEICFPTAVLALTSGPTQPEVKTFEPVGTTEMVNLFSGDFTYNVPLFEVPGPNGGYPVNLFYNSVTNTDEEATWAGLGWNINLGSLGRTMRGVPDDFKGEKVYRKFDMKSNEQWSVGINGGVEIAGGGLGGGLGISYVYNSYKGAGLTVDNSVHFGVGQGKYKPGFNLGLNLSTISDANFNVGFSMGVGDDNDGIGSFNAGLSFNGRDGLTGLSLGYSFPSENAFGDFFGKEGRTMGTHSIGNSISFARASYTPSISIPWTGFNVSGSLSFMPGGTLVYGKIGLKGSYSNQWVQGGGEWQDASAYGYNYTHSVTAADESNVLLDFNREKDGSVSKHTRFLSNPVMTYDVYNVTGQGVGGMFRAHRSEFGWLYDKHLDARSGGFNIGVEAGVWAEFGIDATVNFSAQENRPWALDEVLKYGAEHDFKQFDVNYEPFYYKSSGEMAAEETNTYDYLDWNTPLKLKREGYEYKKELIDTDWNTKVNFSNVGNKAINNRGYRRPRSMSIQPVTNRDLVDHNNNELLPEYDIRYYDETKISDYEQAPNKALSRPNDNDQNAGFTVVGQNGVKWNYTLPVMNHKHREVLFSVEQGDPNKKVLPEIKNTNGDTEANEESTVNYNGEGSPPFSSTIGNTNKFIDEKKLPGYAHSHMLTSVLGNDYADIDGISGPSDGDAGYWMKTNYVQVSNNYQWRAPFMGANYMPGLENTIRDDMGSFMWGEREVYLPATLETKTHIARFHISKRLDGRGANNYITSVLSPGNLTGEYSYKIDKIELFSKKEINAAKVTNSTPLALKTIHFEYDYSLCVGVQNNDFTDPLAMADNPDLDYTNLLEVRGKLTLKKVYFTYEHNTRGALSPYTFDYGNIDPSNPGVYTNEEYSDENIDRWGAYTNIGFTDFLRNPYTKQFVKENNLNSPSAAKEMLDKNIATWHLRRITTPSGASINLELERDDYAYVQDKVVTQMFPMESEVTSIGLQRIYFELEEPIIKDSGAQAKLDKYAVDLLNIKDPLSGEDGKQVYMKAYMNLRNDDNITYEYVPIYATILKYSNSYIHSDPNVPTGGMMTRGMVHIARSKIKHVSNWAPKVAAWQFLKNNLPDKIYSIDLGSEDNGFAKLGAATESIGAIFSGYFKYALNKGFGATIDFQKSFIRLNSPDKVKYGGDIRVKKVTLEDKWNNNETSTIGIVYDYTTEDEDGSIISSGVVQNEPSIGYDECALRYADIYYEKSNFFFEEVVDDIHIYEFPMNEAYFPSAQVGYSKVSVRSIASDYAKKYFEDPINEPLPADLLPGFSTTGQTTNEFYTCKDFPIFTNSTSIDPAWVDPFSNALLSIFAKSRRDWYTGTQGYTIELNDMHGKPKKIASYSQSKDGQILGEPLTMVEYKYKTKEIVKDGQKHLALENKVKVLISDDLQGTPLTADAVIEDRLVGVDYDFFLDSRKSHIAHMSTGIAYSTDIVVWWPIPLPWPSFDFNENLVRTSVANKVIMRRGILEETHAYDGQSHITTTNKVFNGQTGQAVLTTVDNQLDGKLYNYIIPADLAHNTMGAAAQNWGRILQGTFSTTPVTCTGYYSFSNMVSPNLDDLIEGDEFILDVLDQNNAPTGVQSRAIYMGYIPDDSGNNTHQFDALANTGFSLDASGNVLLKNTRSARRNQLQVAIAQYSAVDTDNRTGNPTKNRTLSSCTPSFLEYDETTITEDYADIKPYANLLKSIYDLGSNSFLYNQNNPNKNQGSFWETKIPDIGTTTGVGTKVQWHFNQGTGNLINDIFIIGEDNNCQFNPLVIDPVSGNYTYLSSLLTTTELDDFYRSINLIDVSTATYLGNNIITNPALSQAMSIEAKLSNYQDPKNIVNSNNRIVLYSDFCGLSGTRTVLTADEVIATGTTINYKTINNVLSASGISFSDNWPISYTDYCLTPHQNPFLAGQKGIWRMASTYSYIDDRKQTPLANSNDIDIKESGIVDNVAMYNWETPFFEYCNEKWVRTKNITKYNLEGAAIEARDVVGIYQAEIYGDNDNLVVAKGSNTRYHEIGFESFEEPNVANSLQFLANQGVVNTGNLTFLPKSINCLSNTINRDENYRISFPIKEPNGSNKSYMLVRRPFNVNNPIPSEIKLNLSNGNLIQELTINQNYIKQFEVRPIAGKRFQIPGLGVLLEAETARDFTVYELDLSAASLQEGNNCTINLNPSVAIDWWAGDATFIYQQPLVLGADMPFAASINYTASKAHTGKYSMKLVASPEYGVISFPQNSLRLEYGKEYIFSTWISTDNELTKRTYDDGTIRIFMGGVLFAPTGPIIEGWQRVEGKFTYTGDKYLAFDIINPLYVDDVRVFPAKANIQTYVYDPIDYKLRATLDNNNYATFYVYDPAGNLIIMKRETERGIKTIQETRNYIQPTDPQ